MTLPPKQSEALLAAKTMTKQQRTCGDLLDCFPCRSCSARVPDECPLPPSALIPVRDLINRTRGLGNHLLSLALQPGGE